MIPVPSTFRVIVPSHDGQPAAGFGAIATPAQNAYGAWVTIIAGASVTHDVWEILIRFNDGDSIGATMNMLAQIGIDTAGGTSFTAIIDHLQVSYAGPYLTSGALGIEYKFRLHIPAGSTIGFRTSVNSATLKTVGASVLLFCDPTKPWAVWKGTFVRTFGAVVASSQGTAVTPGNPAEGVWADLGTLAEDLYEWQLGFGADDSTLGSTTYHVDLGVATGAGAKRVVIQNQRNSGTTAEIWNRSLGLPGSGLGLNGDHVFGRAHGSAAPDTTISMMGYGVGGAYTPAGAYTVAGVVQKNGAPVANGKTVRVYAADTDGIAELVASPVTAGGTGAFTVQVPDNVRSYWASYEDGTDLGRSATGTAGVSTFDISFGSGGGDVTPPTITIVSPTVGVAPGAPGGFPADWLAARNVPVILQVTDLAPGVRYIGLFYVTPDGNEEVIYRRGAFRGRYIALSTSTVIANGLELAIRRPDSWPPGNLKFEVDPVDQAGNLSA